MTSFTVSYLVFLVSSFFSGITTLDLSSNLGLVDSSAINLAITESLYFYLSSSIFLSGITSVFGFVPV